MNHQDAFKKMKTLVGIWRVTHDHGRLSEVNYRMSCNDTVLVETWSLKPGIESLTMYNMDGAQLIATHYCPLGNQPRLMFSGLVNEKLKFETQSVTNLTDEKNDHCRAFDFLFVDDGKVERSETYAGNGVSTTESGVFFRVT